MDHREPAPQPIECTTESIPQWMSAPALPVPVTREQRALMPVQFEAVFPRIMDLISSGYTLNNALSELPIELNSGAFLRWIKKDQMRYEAYKEAKEVRTEVWSGKLVEYAEAADSMEDVARSRLKVDTLKWLMGADNRKTYGDVKQVELGGTISITAALAAAHQRVIDAQVIDIEQGD